MLPFCVKRLPEEVSVSRYMGRGGAQEAGREGAPKGISDSGSLRFTQSETFPF